MVIPTPSPHFRKNRRRERPGARKRHALSRKVDLQQDLSEGAYLAHDASFLLPFEQPPTWPHYQSLTHSWHAWMAQEEQWALRGSASGAAGSSEDNEQCRLFGGDADDDAQALRALGILYDSICGDDDEAKDSASGVFPYPKGVKEEDFPPLPPSPRPTAPSQVSKWKSRRPAFTLALPSLLSSYLLDDSQILRLTTLQSPDALFDPLERAPQPQQSLPPPDFPKQFPIPLRMPAAPPPAIKITTTDDASWTLVPTPTPAAPAATAATAPQDPDWVLLDDDLQQAP